MEPSDLEAEFVTTYIQVNGVNRDWFDSFWKLQFAGATPGRKFAFDYGAYWGKTLVEIEGGTHMPKSGHNTADGIERDCTKANLAGVEGYLLFRLTADMLKVPKWHEMIHEQALRRACYSMGAKTASIGFDTETLARAWPSMLKDMEIPF